MSSLGGIHHWPRDRGDGDAAVIFAPSGPSRSEISGELLDAAGASLCGQPPHSSTGSTFWAWLRQDWGLKFFIRVDLEGYFQTYPHVGGPFQSLEEAENAIDCHLQSRRVQKMCMEQAGVSRVEMAIRTCLYWPDGTRKKCSQSHAIEKCREERRLFAQVLVDNYNKDHNLGDTAYELKDIVHYKLIVENYQRLYTCTIISISLRRLKELMIVTWTIYYLLRSKACDKENLKSWWLAVFACLSPAIMVTAMVVWLMAWLI